MPRRRASGEADLDVSDVVAPMRSRIGCMKSALVWPRTARQCRCSTRTGIADTPYETMVGIWPRGEAPRTIAVAPA
jgi:hypothetical protein